MASNRSTGTGKGSGKDHEQRPLSRKDAEDSLRTQSWANDSSGRSIQHPDESQQDNDEGNAGEKTAAFERAKAHLQTMADRAQDKRLGDYYFRPLEGRHIRQGTIMLAPSIEPAMDQDLSSRRSRTRVRSDIVGDISAKMRPMIILAEIKSHILAVPMGTNGSNGLERIRDANRREFMHVTIEHVTGLDTNTVTLPLCEEMYHVGQLTGPSIKALKENYLFLMRKCIDGALEPDERRPFPPGISNARRQASSGPRRKDDQDKDQSDRAEEVGPQPAPKKRRVEDEEDDDAETKRQKYEFSSEVRRPKTKRDPSESDLSEAAEPDTKSPADKLTNSVANITTGSLADRRPNTTAKNRSVSAAESESTPRAKKSDVTMGSGTSTAGAAPEQTTAEASSDSDVPRKPRLTKRLRNLTKGHLGEDDEDE